MDSLIFDLNGYELEQIDREIIGHPTTGGIILFSRNFHDKEQLTQLIKQIRLESKLNNKELLICVDQEGGRVQRFKEGFSLIPPAIEYAKKASDYFEKTGNKAEATAYGLSLATDAGWLMSAELLALDLDFSIAPVLDLTSKSKAIGTRAFGETMVDVIDYATAFILGMKEAGMATTGKHFPGHGGVTADSHLELPIDDRNIDHTDLEVFKQMIDRGHLDAILPSHIIYSKYDPNPAVASSFWLKEILRERLNFQGVIFSDDLNMQAADCLGSYAERCQYVLDAGCDYAILCNNRKGVEEALDNMSILSTTQTKKNDQIAKKRIMRHHTHFTDRELRQTDLWIKRSQRIQEIFF